MSRPQLPPAGVKLSHDVEDLGEGRTLRYRARVRWTDPATKKRVSRSQCFVTIEEADAWIKDMYRAAEGGLTPHAALSTLSDYGDRVWMLAMRGLEPKTLEPYAAGWKKRIVPDIGHLTVRMVSNGIVDRAVHGWIADGASRSTVKNSLAALVRVMEQAYRDGIIDRNPARITGWQREYKLAEDELDDPRALALPDWDALVTLADALAARSHGGYRGWADVAIFAACTAARIGEVSGVRVKDIDRRTWIWTVRRQTTPSVGGLVDKPTKGKRARRVPIMPWLRDLVSARLDALAGKPNARLFTGPRGGRISTAVFRDATHWDEVVQELGYEHLKRHGLRHTGLTWMADAGTKIHVLREVAGHGNISTTQRYLHTDFDQIAAVGDALNAHLLGPAASRPDGPRLRVIGGQ